MSMEHSRDRASKRVSIVDDPSSTLTVTTATRIPDPHSDGTSVAGTVAERLLTARDAANFLRLSESWLSKARMRGDGPPYVKIGRSVRYGEGALIQWMKSHIRQSTNE
jgi:predicted DNA-binding transcriptional regulator AlpA